MSIWLLVVILTRLAHFLVVEIPKLDVDASGFTTCCIVETRDDLGEYARLVQELQLGSDSFQRYFWMSTEQFNYVLRLVGPHISRLSTAYVAVYVHSAGTYARIVPRTLFDVVRSVNAP